MKKIIFYLLVLSVVMVPVFAFAATPSIWPTGYWGPLVSCTGNGAGGSTTCTSLCNLIQTAENVIYFGISVAIFIIAPILLVRGGIMLMFSRGKPEGISKARSILIGTFIGLLIVLGSWLIVNTFVSVVGITGIGGFGTSVCTPPTMPATESTGSSLPNCGLDSFGDCIDLNNAGGNCMVDNNGNCVLSQ